MYVHAIFVLVLIATHFTLIVGQFQERAFNN